MRLKESENEFLARQIVSTVLGAPVDRFEDGTANSQVDALIDLLDGVWALEVVADHEPAYNEQVKALERVDEQVEVPGLRQAWVVQLQRKASVRDVLRELPALLLAWQDIAPPYWPRWDPPAEVVRLKILSVWPIEGSKTVRSCLPCP